ncbi:MAG: sensor histidine kinase [Betaproteobacteria bacterium]|nr:sensor histidine kinase [Betaproteobacteria bacterium]
MRNPLRVKRPTASILQRRYFWFLSGFVAFLLLCISVPQVYFAFVENKQRIAELQSAEARLAANRIAAFIEYQEKQLLAVDSLAWGSGVLTTDDRVNEYERLMKLTPAIVSIEHIDEKGKTAIRVSRIEPNTTDAVPTMAGMAAAGRIGNAGKWYSNTELREGNLPFVNLALRAPVPQSGVSVAEINLKFVTDVVAQMKVGDAGRVYVVDSRYRLVAHPNLSLVLRDTDLSGRLPTDAMRQAEASSDHSLALHDLRSMDGSSVLASAIYIEPTGWWVVAEQPYSEALKSVFDTLRRSLWFLLVGLLLAFAASYLLARAFTAPIMRLKTGAERFGKGDLTTRIDIRSGDEIGMLAQEFNRMAGQLEEYTTGLEQKVAEKTAELHLANRHKSEFLTNISHELRTPLNAIIGFSDVLREEYFGELNDKQKEYVRDIHSSGQHLLSLINDILDIAKVEAGHMELEFTRFSLPATVENALTLVRERARRQNIKLGVDFAPEVGEIVADERKVKQVLINLLSNAVKFSHPDGWVQVGLVRVTNGVRIRVADNGPGIAAEDQETIFQEFRQLPGSGSAKHEGTGLGLALSRQFVELHGGRIFVESELGKGATFVVDLPANKLPEA